MLNLVVLKLLLLKTYIIQHIIGLQARNKDENFHTVRDIHLISEPIQFNGKSLSR